MVYVSVAKSRVKLGLIFGILVRTVEDLTNILFKFSLISSIFGKKLPTVLCDV